MRSTKTTHVLTFIFWYEKWWLAKVIRSVTWLFNKVENFSYKRIYLKSLSDDYDVDFLYGKEIDSNPSLYCIVRWLL